MYVMGQAIIPKRRDKKYSNDFIRNVKVTKEIYNTSFESIEISYAEYRGKI